MCRVNKVTNTKTKWNKKGYIVIITSATYVNKLLFVLYCYLYLFFIYLLDKRNVICCNFLLSPSCNFFMLVWYIYMFAYFDLLDF